MTGDEALIDEIVSGVLEQLQHGERSPRAAAQASGGRKPPVASNTSVPPAHSVHIDAPVVTGDLLEARINGATTVIVSPTAILTPSGRDVIRTRGLELTRQAATRQQSSAARWAAIVNSSNPALEQALDDARSSSIVGGRKLAGTNDEAAATAVGDICRGECDGAAVFTAHPQLVACLANRNRRVRAAIARDAAEVKTVRAAMGANVLCINPAGQSYFALRNVLRQLSESGSPKEPQNWREA